MSLTFDRVSELFRNSFASTTRRRQLELQSLHESARGDLMSEVRLLESAPSVPADDDAEPAIENIVEWTCCLIPNFGTESEDHVHAVFAGIAAALERTQVVYHDHVFLPALWNGLGAHDIEAALSSSEHTEDLLFASYSPTASKLAPEHQRDLRTVLLGDYDQRHDAATRLAAADPALVLAAIDEATDPERRPKLDLEPLAWCLSPLLVSWPISVSMPLIVRAYDVLDRAREGVEDHLRARAEEAIPLLEHWVEKGAPSESGSARRLLGVIRGDA